MMFTQSSLHSAWHLGSLQWLWAIIVFMRLDLAGAWPGFCIPSITPKSRDRRKVFLGGKLFREKRDLEWRTREWIRNWGKISIKVVLLRCPLRKENEALVLHRVLWEEHRMSLGIILLRFLWPFMKHSLFFYCSTSVLGWLKSFGVFCNILWKHPNELSGPIYELRKTCQPSGYFGKE